MSLSDSDRPVRLRLGLIAAACLGLAIASLPPTTATAADAKPARKDSNPRIRPKEVTLTPSVDPAEAKAGRNGDLPGDGQARARLAHLHVCQGRAGRRSRPPRFTTFDFFDTGGLKVVGDWTASKPPIRHKEPAFDNIVLEFYEDEVTWSIKLLVPPGTEPGKKTLRCQAGYQICNDQTCKIPGQWTLPDVVLTVAPRRARPRPRRPRRLRRQPRPNRRPSPAAGGVEPRRDAGRGGQRGREAGRARDWSRSCSSRRWAGWARW